MMSFTACWELLKEAGSHWWKDNAPRLAAGIAFYAVFSLVPLLLIIIAISGRVFGREAAEGQLLAQLSYLVGDQMGAALQASIANAREPTAGFLATVFGAAMVVMGAIWLFNELRDAMNLIWKARPLPGGGAWSFVRHQLLSFSMVLGTAIVLLASLVVSTALSVLASQVGYGKFFLMGEAINFVVTISVTTVLFAMIYRFLPDTTASWKDIWIGAVVTSFLLSIGKLVIGLYLGHSAATSAFGAAGSPTALLIWLYYSAQIFLFGVELTKALAMRRSMQQVAAEDAVQGRLTDEAIRGPAKVVDSSRGQTETRVMPDRLRTTPRFL